MTSKTTIFFLLLFYASAMFAQRSVYHTSEDSDFRRAMELYEKEKFNTAQKFFEITYNRYSESNTALKTLSQYYIAQCAVNLFNEDAEFLTFQFVADNPQSPLVNEAYFNLAGYYYARKKYKDAIDYYDKTDYRKLTKEQKAEYYFKLGYSYFSKKDNEKARVAFYEIIEINTKYTPPALYYYSHIHYKEENYQTALNGFRKLTDDKNFGPIVPYYIVQIYYLQERYQEVVDFAPGMIDQVIEKRLAEVARITAESYFRLERYDEAIPYFEKFMDAAKSVKKEDKYQMAYSYYKSGNLTEAIKLFEGISSSPDLVGQNASYYLADCYLKQNDKQNAKIAFAAASRQDADQAIQQDALFNYAMLTFELANDPFNEAIRAFEEFITKYPESKRIDEAYRFLIQAYLNAKNYKKALASIEKVEPRSDELKEAYQRIAYNRGIELYNNLQYYAASEMFINALKYGQYDPVMKARSQYWLAESYYQMKKYDQAVKYYKAFRNATAAYTTPEFDLVDYNLGYAYFKMKNYSSASEQFRKFASAADAEMLSEKNDAYNRAADCFYMKSEYYSAIDFYGRAIKTGLQDVDYSMLQKGICQGLVNKNNEKIGTLQELVQNNPGSDYADDALYEIAQSHIKLQQPGNAVGFLKKIADDYPQSGLRSQALVQVGLLYYNIDNYDEAIHYYKKTVTEFPGTKEAKDALFGLKNIYVDLNRVDEYVAFVNNMGNEAPVLSVNEPDSLSYVSAEKIYMAGDCERASQAFEKYIANYPTGNYLLNAHFYKGDCNYQKKQFDKALTSFEYVINQPRNMFTEQALIGAARITFDEEINEKSIQYYSQLKSNYSSQGNNREANMAMMRLYFRTDDFKQASELAKTVLADSKTPKDIVREAHYIIAKAYEEEGRKALAIEEYKKIAHEVMSKEGAEAKYRLAQLYYDRDELKEAEKQIIEFSEQSTPHEYWIARSFILWSDVFMKTDNSFQAIQTLESIIDYYETTDDGILDMAREKKKAIVAKQEANEQPADEEDVEVDIISN